ncbi:hypothetical protein BDU57DRAFT_456635 [Ampelomyces quisqualis]|uniref:Vacuolar protein sorting-associated protein 62 n=1 Tax=Ampelomyces quisqualis TaxID=50730 RepID=A0A6A5QGI8_AMPQU|nr:hypothetical protein BDU57DRAFT_456635 [Ampelomyces quisqualis]
MVLTRSSLLVTALAVSAVNCAPTKLEDRAAPAGVPDYVLKYAPVVYLHPDDEYMPTDIKVFLENTTPRVKFEVVPNPPKPLTLDNINQLGGDVFLTSNSDVTQNPQWIKGTKPDKNGRTQNATTAAIIVNDKGNNTVDAFYMYFYAYNDGGKILDCDKLNFGNHIGDWEHTMVRFSHGTPQAVWYAQHAHGQAFAYAAVNKTSSGRPIAYASRGSHASYPVAGVHDITVPNLPPGILLDYTDRGTYWDPVLSALFYRFDAGAKTFSAFGEGEVKGAPTGWLGFGGRWGDEEYPVSDARQVKMLGQAKFASGPTGPADKQLNRDQVCPENNGMACEVRQTLVPRKVGEGGGEAPSSVVRGG